MTIFQGRIDSRVEPASAIHLAVDPGQVKAARVSSDTARGITAVISGQPRWTDAQLAQRAREAGHAAALLEAHRVHGERLFDHLQGSFALAILDQHERTALLAIDRFGTERLCYAARNGALVFATTIKAVVSDPRIGFETDPQALFDYLYHHMIPAPRTIARGVSKLEPGHCVRWSASGVVNERYWHCEFEDDEGTFDEAAHARELLEALETATAESRMNGDAAAFLSGGIDSSTVAGMLARIAPGDAHTFTIGFSAEGYDEMHYARISARHFGTRAHEYYVTPADVQAGIETLAGAFDEPFGNSSVVPAYYCARMAREHGVTHMLAGDGGDELFGGNVRYAKQNVFEWYFRLPAALRSGLIEPLVHSGLGGVGPMRKLRSYVDQALVRLPDRLQTYNYFSREPAAAIMHPDLLAAVNVQLPIEEQRRVFAEPRTRSNINRMLYLDWKYTLADNDLRKVSSACEQAGVQVSYPWLDHRIVELSLRVPGSYKVRGRHLRYFVKRALRHFLPRAVIEKPKHGFGLPFGVWMREDRGLQALVARSMASLRERRLIRADYVDALLRRHREEHAAYYGEFLWVLMMLELWLDRAADRQTRQEETRHAVRGTS